jgi:hypothetical protein
MNYVSFKNIYWYRYLIFWEETKCQSKCQFYLAHWLLPLASTCVNKIFFYSAQLNYRYQY